MPLERGLHVLQGLGHAQTRWMPGPPLIVVEDAAYRRPIIAHHILRRLVRLDRVGRGGLTWGLGKLGRLRRPLFGSDLPCDRSQPPDGPPHLHLGAAVGFQDRLGHIP
jgi:hypothetical protein